MPTIQTIGFEVGEIPRAASIRRLGSTECQLRVAENTLGDHPKAAIGYHFKTGHRETA
jgi:hypothetical protein